MALNRYVYTVSLGLCFLSYLTWGQWLSWVMLQILLVFPWLSLVLSLPAIARFRAEPGCPRQMAAGSWGELSLLGSCPLPVPPFRGRLRVEHLLTGKQSLYHPESGIPTRHCGGYRVTVEKGRVCDYLGLFAFPFRCRSSGFYLVLPRPVPPDPLPEFLNRFGLSEETEPLPYHPGEPIRRIHQKLSLKFDSLILLQPVHRHPSLVLSLELSGNADALDRVLGEFLWLGRKLAEKRIPFVVQARYIRKRLTLPVRTPSELDSVLCRLLSAPMERGHG